MRIVPERARVGVTQAPRHPEVNQERSTRLEPNNQILSAAFQRADALALEFCGDRGRLERPNETWVVDLDAVEPPADDAWLERETNRLHLGQLGHAASLAGSRSARPWTIRRSSRARSDVRAERRRRRRRRRAPRRM